MGRRSRERSNQSKRTKKSKKREVSKVQEPKDESSFDDSQEEDPDLGPPPFPLYEIFQLLNAILATVAIGLVFFGASERWSTKTLGVLFSAAITHLLASLILGIYVSFRAERSKVLYSLGIFLTISSLALSSGVFIFMSEV